MTPSLPLSLATALLLVGCLQEFDQYRPDTGGGGNPPAGGAGGLGGTGGAQGGGGTGGMAPDCEEPGDCPVGICQNPTCNGGTCGITQKPEGEACATGVCTAGGNCVECIEGVADCTAPALCVNGQCATPLCMNDALDAANGETDTDCGGPNCPKCLVDETCAVGTDCITNFCDGGTCAECSPGDCDPTNFCDPTGALDTCVPDLAQGTACFDDAQCPGDFCEDGYCCDMDCDDACESCDSAESAGPNGVCSPVAAGDDPENSCDGGGCFANFCSGVAGMCAFDPVDTGCGTDSCSNAMLTESECDGAGNCVAQAATPCANNFACDDGTSCETSCNSNNDCLPAFHCQGTACVADKANGVACGAGDDGECISGNCVEVNGDNVCCNMPCEGLCQKCDIAGSEGMCLPVPDNTDPDSECSGMANNCNGAGACE